MRKFVAAFVAALMALVGVVATTASAAADPGHRSQGTIWFSAGSLSYSDWSMETDGKTSHIGGLGKVSLQDLTFVPTGPQHQDGYFTGPGSYTASGTIVRHDGSTLDISVAGTFRLTSTAYVEGSTSIFGIFFEPATGTLSNGTGDLAGVTGTATISGGMCQFYRYGFLNLDGSLDVS